VNSFLDPAAFLRSNSSEFSLLAFPSLLSETWVPDPWAPENQSGR
jgi:hypothetical protein